MNSRISLSKASSDFPLQVNDVKFRETEVILVWLAESFSAWMFVCLERMFKPGRWEGDVKGKRRVLSAR